MKKLSDFLIRFRVPILIAMLIFTGVCAFLIPHVNVNKDMTKYLSDSSAMKQGIDIMDEEFPDTEDEYYIRLMLTDVPENEKEAIKKEIKDMAYVDGVSYKQDEEDYNKGEYTLYEITTLYDYDTQEEKAIEDELASRYNKYSPVVESLNDAVVLPAYIIIAVVVVLLVILFLMSGSWFEPIIFLIVIGLAIVVNMGSNFFLSSVSNTTYAIAAILQLVLSMDYSVILMNRYRQEREKTDDKISAMKEALSNSFSSIISSALTTFVGLLMLIFMNYKIGADLGIVLAKGVVCSLLCIFTILPTLIVWTDKILQKTRKPSLHIPMGGIAKFSNKLRYALPAVFAGIFVLFLLLQQITPISFDGTPNREIAKTFPENNRLVVLYNNKDSDKIPGMEDVLEDMPGVSSTASFGTTLDKQRTAEDMIDFLDDMDAEVDMEASDLKLMYYDYFMKGVAPSVKVGDLIHFINDELMPRERYAKEMGDDIKDNITDMVRFADAEMVKQKRSYRGLREFLSGDSNSDEMTEEDMKLMYTYYFSKDATYSPGRMTLNEFVTFIQNDVKGNDTVSSYMNGSASQDFSAVDDLADYTDTNFILAGRNAAEMSGMLGMDLAQTETVYSMYYGNGAAEGYMMTLPELLTYLQEDVLTNEQFASSMPADSAAQLSQLSSLVNVALSGQRLGAASMAAALGMTEEQVLQVYMLYVAAQEGVDLSALQASETTAQDMSAIGNDPAALAAAQEMQAQAAAMQARLAQAAANVSMTLPEFITFMNTNVPDAASAYSLSQVATIINVAVSGTPLGYTEAAQLLSMDASSMRTLYALKAGNETPDKSISLYDMTNFILNDMAADPQMSASFGADEISQLSRLKSIMDTSISGTQLTFTEMAMILGDGTDAEQIKNVFVMNDAKNDPDFVGMSLSEFLHFLQSDILTDESMAGRITPERRKDLNSLTVMTDAVVSGREYDPDGLYELFKDMSDDADPDDLFLLSMLYGSFRQYDSNWKMSILTLFDFISEDVMNDKRFDSALKEEDRAKVTDNRDDLVDAVDQLKGANYSILLINLKLPYESDETTEFVNKLYEMCDETLSEDNYKIGSSAMYHEMQETFGGEMLFITILTAASIFIIVAITFRNLLIPTFLVLIVLCGVFITVAISGLRGVAMNYLAEIIVQCILMGASIDYGILFTSYYRDNRERSSILESLKASYDGSIHTVLTSGLIMVVVTGIIGVTSTDPAIGPICLTLSIGAASAILLILFVLPGMLAAFDKWVVKRKKKIVLNKEQ